MKILLIDPPFKRLTGLVNNYFPIGPGYLAAVARNMGHEVSIYEVDAAKKPTSLDFAGDAQYSSFRNKGDGIGKMLSSRLDSIKKALKKGGGGINGNFKI
jgi:hypothetical protein